MSRTKIYIQYVITILMLSYVFYSTGLFTKNGWISLHATFLSADWRYLVAAFLFTIVLVYVSAVKWFFLTKSIGLKSTLYQLFCFYMVGRYFNLVLPSSIGGDISRIYLLGKAENNKSAAAATVFVDRATGLLALILLALLVTFIYSEISESQYVTLALAISTLIFLIAVWIVISDKAFSWAQVVGYKISSRSKNIFAKINTFRKHVIDYRSNPGSLMNALFWSFVFYLFAIFNVWLCVVAFDNSVSLYSIALAVPIIMIIMNMPISIGNIGLLELSHVFVLGVFGVDPTVVLSAVLIVRLKSLFAACLGWVYLSLLNIEKPVEIN